MSSRVLCVVTEVALRTAALSFASVLLDWQHCASLFILPFSLSWVCLCGIGRREPREGSLSKEQQTYVIKNNWSWLACTDAHAGLWGRYGWCWLGPRRPCSWVKKLRLPPLGNQAWWNTEMKAEGCWWALNTVHSYLRGNWDYKLIECPKGLTRYLWPSAHPSSGNFPILICFLYSKHVQLHP